MNTKPVPKERVSCRVIYSIDSPMILLENMKFKLIELRFLVIIFQEVRDSYY